MSLNQTRNRSMNTSLKKQQGSMLVIALFVIIVLGFLAYAMIQITDNSNRSTVFEVYGTRALNAANSGAEHTLNSILGPDGTQVCPNETVPSIQDTVEILPDIASFNGCNLDISCSRFDVIETGLRHFRIKSVASCSAGDFNTQRSVSVEAQIATPPSSP